MASRASSSRAPEIQRGVSLLRGFVESSQDQVPGFAVVWHVRVLVTVEVSCAKGGVDHLGNRDARLIVLCHDHVAERA